jgi:hypothetical protein
MIVYVLSMHSYESMCCDCVSVCMCACVAKQNTFTSSHRFRAATCPVPSFGFACACPSLRQRTDASPPLLAVYAWTGTHVDARRCTMQWFATLIGEAHSVGQAPCRLTPIADFAGPSTSRSASCRPQGPARPASEACAACIPFRRAQATSWPFRPEAETDDPVRTIWVSVCPSCRLDRSARLSHVVLLPAISVGRTDFSAATSPVPSPSLPPSTMLSPRSCGVTKRVLGRFRTKDTAAPRSKGRYKSQRSGPM